MYEFKLQAYFHDSPEKTIKITKHEERAKEILSFVGVSYQRIGLIKEADILASEAQRIIKKEKIEEEKEPASDFYASSSGKYYFIGYPVLIHPVSGEILMSFDNLRGISEDYGRKGIEKLLEEIIKAEKDALKEVYEEAKKFKESGKIWAFIWENYPKKLKKKLMEKFKDSPDLVGDILFLPAETRFPDHTIWQHLDLVSALAVDSPVLVWIKIVPVQQFIANSRKQLDLWASSHLLSLLMYKSLEVIINKNGPESIIYPRMRDQPFFLINYLKDESAKDRAKIANLPNKAIAIVSKNDVYEIEKEIKDTILELLKELYNYALSKTKVKLSDEKREEYFRILEDYFTVSVEWIELDKFIDGNEAKELLEKAGLLNKEVKDWLGVAKPTHLIRLYPFLLKILDGLGNAKISIERFKKEEQNPRWKCSVCGENLAILGDELSWSQLKEIWNGEPLCPVCLVKRYYPQWVKEHFGIVQRFESVVDVALLSHNWIFKFNEKLGEKFIEALKEVNPHLVRDNKPIDPDLYYAENIEKDTLKEKLEEAGYKEEKLNEEAIKKLRGILGKAPEGIGDPPKYYAILMMDGDDMGKLISGEGLQELSKRMHPGIRRYEELSSVKYFATPQLHMTISEALANYSIIKVPEIVGNTGLLIYAGGDDVLAILPVDKALEIARELRKTFGYSIEDDKLLLGWKMSAGLLIVHYKHPLHDALEKARNLLRSAKKVRGKDSIGIGLLKRSGTYYTVVAKWELIDKVLSSKILERLKGNEAGRRIIYEVMREASKWPEDCAFELLKYEVKRHIAKDDKELLNTILLELRDMSNYVAYEAVNERIVGLFYLLKILLNNEVMML